MNHSNQMQFFQKQFPLIENDIFNKFASNNSSSFYSMISQKIFQSEETLNYFSQMLNLTNSQLKLKENKNAQLEANVVIIGIPLEIQEEELKEYFSAYGEILSLKKKIKNDIGNVFIQFEKTQGADYCLECTHFQEHKVKVEYLIPRLNRNKYEKKKKDDLLNNIYVKHLPSYFSEEELTLKINYIFEKFGKINSIYVCTRYSEKRPCAFISYEKYESGELAIQTLRYTDPFLCGKPLFVAWSKTFYDKMKKYENEN